VLTPGHLFCFYPHKKRLRSPTDGFMHMILALPLMLQRLQKSLDLFYIVIFDFCVREVLNLFWSLRESEPLMCETIDIIFFIQN
jgi:hypothetical protein